ncbi:hypothetical protein AAZX31_12G187900 [Glycine max]|uniref:Uncharacterized protein n=2 Tax=Glycine subgen. Soja TaxID=1462606 RepID=K7LVZ8_SOYBN|nr:uncharacterized protein LOC106795392 [Glycine max]XP_028194170.1 uncharacterized protein LOC114379680 [Glycine soja]KAH1144064.1 hypothetical protein GYH30_034325 [Glycine max]KHN04303.1 hypothetical protein glysoja_037983 [Glycine soja]KRH26872.1 hypothetical protein GLYMA_12G198900v4 [Glycine max]RZB76759.1 hypothetical protein D0Y65_034939 [Glycine soja]|eukprot:XP_014620329.1 uncharacterized protein LOC106795392 [Glycine max]
MRNVSKNKWFLTCFRPVVDIDDMLEPRAVVDHSANRRFTCIPVADKHDTKDSVTKTTFSEQEFAQNWVVVPHPQKRKFSKNTRARNKNLDGQSCFGSKGGYSASTESSSTGDEKKQAFAGTNIPKIKPPEWSSRISSSNSPESKSESPKDQVEKQKKFQCVGIYWVLLSLVVTVFWGKVNVTIWTSLLLFFFFIWNAICSSCGTQNPKHTRIAVGTVVEGVVAK